MAGPSDPHAPFPVPPICLPGETGKAIAFAEEVEAALGGEHWTRAERIALRRLYRIWKLRALGEDPHFLRYGTFHRPPGAPPPTPTDAVIQGWRRRFPRPKRERIRLRGPSRWRPK